MSSFHGAQLSYFQISFIFVMNCTYSLYYNSNSLNIKYLSNHYSNKCIRVSRSILYRYAGTILLQNDSFIFITHSCHTVVSANELFSVA